MSASLATLLVSALLVRGESRCALAEVVLEGPCAAVELDLGRAGSTRVEGPLAAGERRTRLVPLPVFGEAPRLVPDVRVLPLASGEDAGAARFAGWHEDGGLSAALPHGLRARALPPVAAPQTRARPAEVLLLAGAFLLAVLRPRRAAWVLAVSLAAAPALYALAGAGRAPRSGTASAVRVFEGDAASGRWLQVDAAAGGLAVSPRGLDTAHPGFELECEPARRPLRWSVPLDAAAPWAVTDAEGRRTTRLVRRGELLTTRGLTRAANAWGDLEQVWLRDAEGGWASLGAWREGAPLPERAPGVAPPGWLASGLPQGVEVLLARLAPGAFAGEGPAPPGEVFLRQVGP
jgi:hypothetical protein